ncbi:MAG: hypothetical protein IK119_02535 [Bacteroidales bacterium]|nr:hypothetical protein [Bacteroidales bacterium]
MINCLARASEVRGTDATGIAYNSRNRMRIYKRPMAAHKLRLKVPEDATTIIGHTRLTTQGNEKLNYNNHPWAGRIGQEVFALAHNGVLHNDTWLRKSMKLPKTKVETDSYIAVQLIEQKRALTFDSLKYMAEKVEGSFSFSVLDQEGRIFLVKGDNPLCLYYFPSYDLYIYASTQAILTDALVSMPFYLGKPEEIRLTCGDILRISPDREPEKQTFDTTYFDISYWNWHYPPSRYLSLPSDQPTYTYSDFDAEYLEDLKMVAGAYGYSPDAIDEMFQCGYTPEEIEDMLYCCCGEI